jgi:hypothetical protein
MRLTILVVGLSFCLACGDPPEPEALGQTAGTLLVNQETGEGYHPTLDEDGNLEEPPDWVKEDLNPTTTGPIGANTVTLHGRVFFNDRREHGLFSARKTRSGAKGTRCNPDGLRNDGTPCSD